MMYWCGVATIAGALRRKCWIDLEYYKWAPNFYILLVGPPGLIRKSTSINIGLSMLAKIPGINFGADSTTWQALITDMASKHELVTIDGEMIPMTCITLGLDEFGSFYDPTDRDMSDALTHLWDTKARTFRKMTKGGGDEVLENPFINLIGCTQPNWLTTNMPESFAGGGLASRFVYLYEDGTNIKDIAYPHRASGAKKDRIAQARNSLETRLYDIAAYKGPYTVTDAALEWGEDWYMRDRATLRESGFNSMVAWFAGRNQVMLHKLAMVISAARGRFPLIDVPELQEAQRRLTEIQTDALRIFGYVGLAPMGKATVEMIDQIEHDGPIDKRTLWRTFYRKLRPHEFEEALNGALSTGFIIATGNLANPTLCIQGLPKRRQS